LTPAGRRSTRTRGGYLEIAGHRTWYRVTGQSKEGRDPLLCLHGGPGATHHYFAPLEGLAEEGRAVVVYDQVGCGSSERPEGIEWGVRVFLDELASLRDQLGLERVHLLGTSWGGMLALEHALDGYGGLTSLVLSSTLASMDEWAAEALRLRGSLPADVVATMERCEADGDFESSEYRQALDVFDSRYVHRGAIGRPELARMRAGLGTESYQAMVGPSEWIVTGALSGWDVRPRLAEIATPALVVRGVYDMCTEPIAATLLRGLPNAREAVFAESSHMPALEEPKRYRTVVGAFLNDAETA
jgi:proline-specific peptidase